MFICFLWSNICFLLYFFSVIWYRSLFPPIGSGYSLRSVLLYYFYYGFYSIYLFYFYITLYILSNYLLLSQFLHRCFSIDRRLFYYCLVHTSLYTISCTRKDFIFLFLWLEERNYYVSIILHIVPPYKVRIPRIYM